MNLPYALPGTCRGILFDLDGTLLKVEMKEFIPAYLDALYPFYSDLVRRDQFIRLFKGAISYLLSDDNGSLTNEEKFFLAVNGHLQIDQIAFRRRMTAFCEEALPRLAHYIHPEPIARNVLQTCFEANLKVAIATNPVFPLSVIKARLSWGEIDDFPFHWIASMENTRYCKPHEGFFHDTLDTLGLTPNESLMVGNDTQHDLGARSVGIPVFLVETWMIDRNNGIYATDFHGDLSELLFLLETVSPAYRGHSPPA